MAAHSTVLILDFGSQYTQLIARRVRELGVFSRVVPGSEPLSDLEKISPQAIILSGGPSSVYESDAPKLSPGFWDYQAKTGTPVLGICYGMQLMSFDLGGKVRGGHVREYGRMKVSPVPTASGKTDSWPLGPGAAARQMWMSHGDEIEASPSGFEITARSESGVPAAMVNRGRKLFALQFHPEVTHSEQGIEVLKRFLFEEAKVPNDWKMGTLVEELTQKIREQAGSEGHAICALSGGVDSAVAAVLVHRAIGDRLHCVFVDHGLLRFEEQKRVMKMFQEKLHLPVKCVDASERFLSKLAGIADPERKRKIIGAEFIAVFDEEGELLAKTLGHAPKYLVQGTLYPDVIESSPPPHSLQSNKKFSTTIKSHHNVGGLPKDMKFKLIEPLRDLFKDEVRALGRELGVPTDFLSRHPFPGPGLAVRIIGDITRDRVDVLQRVDEIFIQSIREAGLYDKIWQAFAVFLPIKSVGVQGDGRTHDHVVALRAVTSSDGMTADWFHFDPNFLAQVSNKICNQVRGVNRVVYDISSKPPATIEWE